MLHQDIPRTTGTSNLWDPRPAGAAGFGELKVLVDERADDLRLYRLPARPGIVGLRQGTLADNGTFVPKVRHAAAATSPCGRQLPRPTKKL
ncbi:hypothetical protein [uncultured Azohydromonas sp.]|jgi:hypothetical protein|uniref:hypothetical protein n=1 Tax=uncultured Azohydromonas sp. TaxID=487342 RepID=UPI00262B85D3|nr:hypothetical protein [uncultured Azohydromonas sp.]